MGLSARLFFYLLVKRSIYILDRGSFWGVVNWTMSSSRVAIGAPALIEHKNMRFLITDRPTSSNLTTYVQQLKRHNVKNLVRVCEPTYGTEKLQEEGILVKDWVFSDGGAPPDSLIKDWLNLLEVCFSNDLGSCIAVHCVAGLGRAPVLVAVALIESGLRYEDAVELIRTKRRGAINAKQLAFLATYQRNHKRRNKCVIQ
ncbi:PRL-1 phosphatase-like [Corticium candelabrum]|uniref:PRL-1 phosphatase-like n=1 Tax=Corticium candelabrum TaxID=121492 RepID=UPI002E25457D|nr:PRL-1 phosphatase-like [Corticium candelabrum]